MTSASWSLQRGATLLADNSVRFTLWAPRARRVRVQVCAGTRESEHDMQPSEDARGVFSARVPDVGAGADYAFALDDDDRALPDPVSRWQPHGVHGASRVVDPLAFDWTDDDWRGRAMRHLVIYELHVGTFTPEGTFAAAIPRLRDLASLGITAMELMPVAQFPGARNWGYDGVGLYAVQNSYGGPVALKQLVDAAHAMGIAVILDVVYNHVGPEGNYLDRFGPYFADKYRTPWGRALNYDDAESDEVRRFVLDNALYWATEYHVDGLRLDAVHGIFDFSATHLLQEIATSVHAQARMLGRDAVVIGESDLNDPRLIRSVDHHGYGLDAQWSDDFHHAVHAALTGERAGYYSDFGSPALVADAMREPFVYGGRYSEYRRRRHGASSAGIPRDRFVVAIQNHDQVGNRAAGDRLSTLLEPDQLRLAASLLLLSPYVPLVFMGEEYGETNPFQYFVSHGDEDLVRAVREGRAREFESFAWAEGVPDPQDPATFGRSKLDWDARERAGHAELLRLYTDLIALRREEPLLEPNAAELEVANGEPGWITLLRRARADDMRRPRPLLALFNLGAQNADVALTNCGAAVWSLRWSSDAPGYGGRSRLPDHIAGQATDEPRRLLGPRERTLQLPPWTAALYIESPPSSA